MTHIHNRDLAGRERGRERRAVATRADSVDGARERAVLADEEGLELSLGIFIDGAASSSRDNQLSIDNKTKCDPL